MKPVNPGAISPKKILHLSITLAILGATPFVDMQQTAFAADETESTSTEKTYDIPAGPLSTAISSYAAHNGVRLTFDPALADGKSTDGLQGQYKITEGFEKLLQGSGLQVVDDQAGGYFLVPGQEGLPGLGEDRLILDTVKVRAKRFYEVGPLPGLGLTKEEIPSNVQSISAKEIKEAHSVSMVDLFNKKLQGVTVNDYQGNPFQMDVQYRGFTAGPQIGTPQGLSVFFDGVRVNEPFGDVVNWDMIPMNAIAAVDIFPGSNPIFGLNTLGGAFTVKTKDGFNNTEMDAEVLAGSFGRKQLQIENGWNNGTFALFGAGNFFMEDGWRENSPTEVNQAFVKASYRGDKLDLNLSTLLVSNDMVGNGMLPSEMYEKDRNASFTSEDTTENRLKQFQLAGAYQAKDNFSITAQVYRRDSKRSQKGADVYTDYENNRGAKFVPDADDDYTCKLLSTNEYGIPDYYVVSVNRTQGEELFFTQFWNEAFITQDIDLNDYSNLKNTELSDKFVAGFKASFYEGQNFARQFFYNRGALTQAPEPGEVDYNGNGFTEAATSYGVPTFGNDPQMGAGVSNPSYPILQTTGGFDAYFTTYADNGDIYQNFVIFESPVNNETCRDDFNQTNDYPGPYNIINPETGFPYLIDGADLGEPGWVEGTPTAIVTNNEIDQMIDGASIQFNWNLDQHKFMIGASIDDASASYSNTQQLGFMDSERNVYLDPEQANPQFGAAYYPLTNNNFSGTNTTMSVYFSETWSPMEKWNFNFSGRYNHTQTKNKVATRYGFGAFEAGAVRVAPDEYDVCTTEEECNTPQNYTSQEDLTRLTVNPPETEEFDFYSFNPSIGATWQAKENLNIYGNWSQGSRVPSVIELGCAFDDTPVYVGGDMGDRNDPDSYRAKSITENRQCYLPTTLSGDPYLPQIRSTSYDFGLRGMLGENLQWNLGIYQTDLKDDIYFVAVPGGGGSSGFFDSIGDTRRRGLEAGLSGQKGRWGFSVNYSMTDASFENDFFMYSEDNSSAQYLDGYGSNTIKVEKGDKMPGVPLHNLNATLSYMVTPKWQVSLTGIAHSEIYVRGNENNDHETGKAQLRQVTFPDGSTRMVARQTPYNPGKLPGFATFNFQTSYKFTPNLTVNFLVNNIFDKEYFTAGRLGRNPFSPSINGAIGPDGYNHNSSDWLSSNFIAPGAPRGAWLSVNWVY
ncbi:TonB-dependent receptor [uncultured Methylophaga sp.]|uniref:TonB-dependent receptor domain-containing protein n=1 Tax=uncultured Methylophaga sp. TaxID=285271 RepID=UPI002638B0B4|nr:TonB-dependent receptor [uncultured Methylophaga sp.]